MVEGKEHNADPYVALPKLIEKILAMKAETHSFGVYTVQITFKEGYPCDLKTTDETTLKFKR